MQGGGAGGGAAGAGVRSMIRAAYSTRAKIRPRLARLVSPRRGPPCLKALRHAKMVQSTNRQRDKFARVPQVRRAELPETLRDQMDLGPGPGKLTVTQEQDSDAKINEENRRLNRAMNNICRGC